MYDVVIVGSGVSAYSAALFVAREKLSVEVLARGALAHMSPRRNKVLFPGFEGTEASQLISHIRAQAEAQGVTVAETHGQMQKISFRLEDNREVFMLEDAAGTIYEGCSVIIASGKRPRVLGVPGEEEFFNKGVYFELLQEPSKSEEVVAVVGGGQSGLAAALELSRRAQKVYVLEIGGRLGESELFDQKLSGTNKVEYVLNAAVQRIGGEERVASLTYMDKSSGEIKELPLQAVYVMIGLSPNTDFLKGFCELNQWGEIVINSRTNATSHVGVFAAGDATDTPEKEDIIAAGEGVKAALSCAKWLKGQK